MAKNLHHWITKILDGISEQQQQQQQKAKPDWLRFFCFQSC